MAVPLRAEDGVGLPVAAVGAALDGGWARGDGPFAGEPPPAVVAPVALPGAVPPAARIMQQAGSDRRDERMDRAAIAALDRRNEAGEFAADPAVFCRAPGLLTIPANFADSSLAARVPDACRYENERPVHLWPYFEALLGSMGDLDWLDEIGALDIPRLVVHGREDGIPLAGARAWAAGFPNARLLVLSPAGHFPFLEQPDAFFPGCEPLSVRRLACCS